MCLGSPVSRRFSSSAKCPGAPRSRDGRRRIPVRYPRPLGFPLQVALVSNERRETFDPRASEFGGDFRGKGQQHSGDHRQHPRTPHEPAFRPPGRGLGQARTANPGGSIKDRIALAMIEDAEARRSQAGRHDHRADLGQHRHRPGPRRRR